MPPHAIVMADATGTICHWNEGAEMLFGFSAAEALGQSLDLIVPLEYRERHWAAFKRAVETGICKLDRATTNIPVACKDGAVRPFPGRFLFLQGARGEVIGAMALYSIRQGSEVVFGPIIELV